jgi:SAM-dependent methyltransferase
MFHYSQYPFGASAVPETWGSVSFPPKSAAELELDDHLQRVPANGVVMDVGAGPGLSLGAAIQLKRPDLTVVAIDSGFMFGNDEETEQYRAHTIDAFSDEQQLKLAASNNWRNKRVAGVAEQLPVRSGVADLVVSYAAVPEYTFAEPSLEETIRVLKVGGLAVNGPMTEWGFKPWDHVVQEALGQAQIAGYSIRQQIIWGSGEQVVDAYFSSFVKS